MPTRHIGISLGMIDSLSDGLGEFSTQICERLAAAAPAWQREGIRFHFHMPQRWHGRFGPDVNYLATHKHQGYLNWQGLRRFDVWHGLNQLGRIIPPPLTRHAMLTIHDLNPLHHDCRHEAHRYMGKLRMRLRHFDAVTTLTRHVETDIREHLAWRGPIAVIPNGARDLRSHPQDPVEGPTPGHYLLHLSRMAPTKNPQAILELAAIWPEQQFVLAGPRCGDSNQVRAAAETRGLRNVVLIQEVSDAQKTWLYANCQGFLFPSLTEGFGLPPLEAMHFGKPVYLARLTSLPEIGGDWAAYFDTFEPQAMRRLIESEGPRLLNSAPQIQAHAAHFNWDRSALAYLELYRRQLT